MAAEAGSWLLTAIDNASGRESHLQAHTHTHTRAEKQKDILGVRKNNEIIIVKQM